MPRPKVIFVNRVYWPSEAATAQLLTDLAEVLAARGWPVHVIATGADSGPRNSVMLHRTGAGDVHGGLLSRVRNYARFLSAARDRLAVLAQRGDIVVLKTDPPLLAASATSVARRRGAHVVQWIQDVYPEIVTQHVGAWSAPLLWPLQWARNHAWRAADRCVPVGGDMRPLVAAQGVRPDNVLVMPNWAPRELDAPAPSESVAAVRAAWGVGDKFIAAYSGNLGRVHEFSTLLDAAERLRSDANIVFLFIGAGPRFDEVRAAAERRRLTNVRLQPPQPRAQLAATLAAADAHFVTLRPGFERLVNPSKLAGILAAGRPALFVGPPQSEIAGLLAREQCGLAFSPGEGAALAGAIASLARDHERRLAMGRAARTTHERHFAFSAAVTRWDELLRHVAGR